MKRIAKLIQKRRLQINRVCGLFPFTHEVYYRGERYLIRISRWIRY